MNTPIDNYFDVMSVQALDVSTATAEQVARERWGIAGRAKLLTGERDRNFYFRAEDGREFVLKFANPVEDAATTDMQIKGLRHIERVDPGMPVPRVVPLLDGSVETLVPHETGGIQRVRLLTWLPGVSLKDSRRSAAQRRNLGAALARVGKALQGFSHPAQHHPLIWDMQHALRLRALLEGIHDPRARGAITAVFDEFEARVMPALPGLRRGVLHNDLNGLNTIMDADDHDQLGGLIDFGDMVETAVIIDVATGGPAQIANDMPMAEAVHHYVAGYHAVTPLMPEEIDLLPLMMATRICMGTVLQSWHRHVQPDNPHYSDITEERLAARLAMIAGLKSDEVLTGARRGAERSGDESDSGSA